MRLDDVGAPSDLKPSAKLDGPLTREQLYELVWQEPMLRIGERLGISSSYMARVCTELREPRPAPGYWWQLEFGKNPTKPPLPEARPGDVTGRKNVGAEVETQVHNNWEYVVSKRMAQRRVGSSF